MTAPAPPQEEVKTVDTLLAQVKEASGGRLLTLHTDLARSPAVLAAYLGLRNASGEYGTLDPAIRAAIMLTVGAVNGSDYSRGLATHLALAARMSMDQTVAVRAGRVEDARVAALLAVIREAAASRGIVSEATWAAASEARWSDEQLIEAFHYFALTVFVDYFVNYARTPLDVPPAPPIPSGGAR